MTNRSSQPPPANRLVQARFDVARRLAAADARRRYSFLQLLLDSVGAHHAALRSGSEMLGRLTPLGYAACGRVCVCECGGQKRGSSLCTRSVCVCVCVCYKRVTTSAHTCICRCVLHLVLTRGSNPRHCLHPRLSGRRDTARAVVAEARTAEGELQVRPGTGALGAITAPCQAVVRC